MLSGVYMLQLPQHSFDDPIRYRTDLLLTFGVGSVMLTPLKSFVPGPGLWCFANAHCNYLREVVSELTIKQICEILRCRVNAFWHTIIEVLMIVGSVNILLKFVEFSIVAYEPDIIERSLQPDTNYIVVSM